jgi:hypothetical protein
LLVSQLWGGVVLVLASIACGSWKVLAFGQVVLAIVLLGDWVAGFDLAVWLLDGLSAGFVFCF